MHHVICIYKVSNPLCILQYLQAFNNQFSFLNQNLKNCGINYALCVAFNFISRKLCSCFGGKAGYVCVYIFWVVTIRCHWLPMCFLYVVTQRDVLRQCHALTLEGVFRLRNIRTGRLYGVKVLYERLDISV